MYPNSKALKEVDIHKFGKCKRISNPGFGFIYKVKNRYNDFLFAAKILDCCDNEEECDQKVSKIVSKIQFINHPALINYLWYSKLDFREEYNITLIMEFAENGSFYDLLQKSRFKEIQTMYTNTSRQKMIAGIARGMKYLHDRNIIHGDLNSSDILLDSEFEAHISDYYKMNVYLVDQIASQKQYYKILSYKAPEAFSNHFYSKQSDVYSFGIIAYEILTDSKAYPELELNKIPDFEFKHKIVHENLHPKYENITNTSLRELVSKCCSKNPSERPFFDQIFNQLSNKNGSSKHYFLPGVDEDEYNHYIEKIYDSSDPSEILVDRIMDIKQNNEQFNKLIGEVKAQQEETDNKIKQIEEDCETFNQNDKNQPNEEEISTILDKNFAKIENNIKSIESQQKKLNKQMSHIVNENAKINSYIEEIQKEIKQIKSNNNSDILNEDIYNEKFISEYNKLPLKDQQKTSEKLSKSSAQEINEFFNKLNSLNLYLLKFNEISEHCIQLITNNTTKLDDINKYLCIQVLYPTIEFLFNKEALNSTDFLNLLNEFECIYLEIKYPSSCFKSIYDIVLNSIISKSKRIKIGLFITEIEETDMTFKGNQNINYIKLDSTIHFIKGGKNLFNKGSFSGCSSLTQISISSSLISIGNFSFTSCSSLTQILIPSSVTSIGNYAFTNCSSLVQVSIPSSVTSIGVSSFSSCSSLTQISIPSSINEIKNDTFNGCSSLTQISIPSSVTSVGNNAFSGCSSLTQISIPSSVTIIGSKAFYECKSLSQISIPSSVKEIKNEAFNKCSLLKQISIPSSMSSIEEFVFKDCTSLKEISIPSSVTSIKEEAFCGCSSLSQISIHSRIKSIGKSAFRGCSSLSEISIPSSMSLIGEAVFKDCSSLKEISIPSSITSIGNNAFSGCSSLAQITIPSSVTSIGKASFEECSSLTQITIPSSVISIGESAFKECSSLKQASILSSVTKIEKRNAFRECSSLEQLSIPSSFNSSSLSLPSKTEIITF